MARPENQRGKKGQEEERGGELRVQERSERDVNRERQGGRELGGGEGECWAWRERPDPAGASPQLPSAPDSRPCSYWRVDPRPCSGHKQPRRWPLRVWVMTAILDVPGQPPLLAAPSLPLPLMPIQTASGSAAAAGSSPDTHRHLTRTESANGPRPQATW